MQYLLVVLYGMVQGVTEFLPVSSSGHLVLLHEFFPLNVDALSFDVALHVGTVLALIIYFRRDLANYARAFSFHDGHEHRRHVGIIALSMIPAVAVGYYYESVIEAVFRSPLTVVAALIIGALLLVLVEYLPYTKREMHHLRWYDGLFIGFAQAVALIPGVSRSGITISAGMIAGLHREAATRFSFLMAIPIVAAAGARQLAELIQAGTLATSGMFFALGTLTAALCGWVTIHYFLIFVKNYRLHWFAAYRIALAVLILFLIV